MKSIAKPWSDKLRSLIPDEQDGLMGSPRQIGKFTADIPLNLPMELKTRLEDMAAELNPPNGHL